MKLFKILIISLFPLLVNAQGVTLNTITVTSVIQNTGDWLFYIFIIGATIGFIIAAYYYLTAQGDPGKAKTAQQIVVYTIIAIIIAIFARGFTQFILTITGTNVTLPLE